MYSGTMTFSIRTTSDKSKVTECSCDKLENQPQDVYKNTADHYLYIKPQ